MDEEFIRNRITELRLKKGVSEYQMSMDLGQNKNYVQAISITFLLPYCYFNYVGNLQFMGQTIKFILFDLKFPKFESHHRKNPPKDQCLPEDSYLFIHIFILSI